jgi:hypothetical protein
VRRADANEVRRYQDRLKEENADSTEAAIELGESCIVYPTGEKLARVKALFPAVLMQAGLAAGDLASAKRLVEGKGR